MAYSGISGEAGAASYLDNVTPTTILTNAQGAGKIIEFTKLLVININTSTARTLQLYKMASGGSISGDDWKVIKDRDINPSDGLFGTDDIREVAGAMLENGDSLRGLAGTASQLRWDYSAWAES